MIEPQFKQRQTGEDELDMPRVMGRKTCAYKFVEFLDSFDINQMIEKPTYRTPSGKKTLPDRTSYEGKWVEGRAKGQGIKMLPKELITVSIQKSRVL